jgi:hypothetical protein
MADLIPVTFNEGEPLDPKKLNDLRLNITNTYQAAAAFQSSTASGTQTLLMDAGTITVACTQGTISTAALQIDAKFKTSIPYFLVSIGSEIYTGDVVSVGVKGNNTQTPQAVINYSASTTKGQKRNFVVNWIAFIKQ